MNNMLEALQHGSQQYAETIALDDGEQSINYATLLNHVSAIADKLKARGVRRIGLLLDNSVEYAVLDLATIVADIVCVPIPPFFSDTQKQFIVDAAQLDHVIVGRQTATPWLCAVLYRDHFLKQVDLLQLLPANAIALPTGTAKISFTSGTTGAPKGVCLSVDQMMTVARSINNATQSVHSPRHQCLLPFSVLLENIAGLYAGLLRGATVYCHAGDKLGLHGSSRFDAAQFLAQCDARQISSCIVLPQMLHALLMQRRQNADRGRSVVFVAVGGGKVASALLHEAQRQQWPVFEGYGLTEAASVVALNTATEYRRGSVGKKLDHITLTVENGELVIENNRSLGYLGDNAALPSRFYTGDLGYCDDDGFVYITGRKKNMFITAFGRNVSPEWIESELNALPNVAQSFVYGEAKASNIALIVARQQPVDRTHIAEQLNSINVALPDYARVADFLVVDEPFSQHNGMLTDNGRLRRNAILQRYQQRIEQHYQLRGEQHGVF